MPQLTHKPSTDLLFPKINQFYENPNCRLRVAKFMKNDFLKNLFIIKKIFGFLSIKAFDDFIYQTAC